LFAGLGLAGLTAAGFARSPQDDPLMPMTLSCPAKGDQPTSPCRFSPRDCRV